MTGKSLQLYEQLKYMDFETLKFKNFKLLAKSIQSILGLKTMSFKSQLFKELLDVKFDSEFTLTRKRFCFLRIFETVYEFQKVITPCTKLLSEKVIDFWLIFRWQRLKS